MSTQGLPAGIRSRYEVVGVRGRRIARLEETDLGLFELSAETAWHLGTNNLGVFVGGMRSLGPTIERLTRLESRSSESTWIIVAATKKMAAVIVQRWFEAPTERDVAVSTLQLPKMRGNIVLSTPEALKRIGAEAASQTAGIILVDMLCQVHRARKMPPTRRGFVIQNDRPQLISDFRGNLTLEGWAPPLIILAGEPAKAIHTSTVARSYCLDGLLFVDGRSLMFHGSSANKDGDVGRDRDDY